MSVIALKEFALDGAGSLGQTGEDEDKNRKTERKKSETPLCFTNGFRSRYIKISFLTGNSKQLVLQMGTNVSLPMGRYLPGSSVFKGTNDSWRVWRVVMRSIMSPPAASTKYIQPGNGTL